MAAGRIISLATRAALEWRPVRGYSFFLLRARKTVPFYIVGRAAYNSQGIGDVLNLDGTGPELLQQDWVETNWMPDARSGYYVTTLYQQRGLYWYRADGRHGERTFPLYEKWAILPGMKPELAAGPTVPQSLLADYRKRPQGWHSQQRP